MLWATQYPWRFKWVLMALGLGLMAVLAWTTPQTFKSFDERSDNWTWNMQTNTAPERRLVVVDIDEKSVQALGAWPWSRQTMADLVTALNIEGAGLKLFDIVLPETKAGDQALQQALSMGSPNVGGQIFSVDPLVQVRSGVLAAQDGVGPCPASAQAGFGFIGNAPDLAPYFSQVGHLTPVIDPDGAVRHVPSMVCFEGKSYPALALAALMQMGQASARVAPASAASTPVVSPSTQGLSGSINSSGSSARLVKGQSWLDAPWSINIKNWPNFSLPLNERGHIRVSYRTPRSQFVSLSASDVMAHRVPKDLLSGAWVLVGSTAFGSGDAIPTPHGGAEGGLEVHAQLISAALDQATPYTPMGAWILQSGFVVLGLLAVLGLSVLPSRLVSSDDKPVSVGVQEWHKRERFVFALPLAGVLALLVSFGLHAWTLLELNCWIGWSLCAGFLLAGTVSLSVGDLMVLRWQRTRLYENLSRYLNEPVAKEVALQEASAVIDALDTQVVVLALNVRNFDRYCDAHGAQASAEFLHGYLNLVTTSVMRQGGEVHHVQGAQVLALWRCQPSTFSPKTQRPGEPGALRETEKALCAAQALWLSSQAWADLQDGQELELEMGLESGEALLGSVGSHERRFQAVMGEPVVVAQALRDMVAELSYPLLVGPQLVEDLVRGSTVFEMRQNSGLNNQPFDERHADMDSTHTTTAQTTHETSQVDALQGQRLGEFLLPGTTRPRLVYACALEVNAQRLHVVGHSEFFKRVA
jgi:adenylate cyclase